MRSTFNRLSNLKRCGMMDHVPKARKQNETTSMQLAMKPVRLATDIGDLIISSGNYQHRHRQVSIMVLQFHRGWAHERRVLGGGAKLRRSDDQLLGKTRVEVLWYWHWLKCLSNRSREHQPCDRRRNGVAHDDLHQRNGCQGLKQDI